MPAIARVDAQYAHERVARQRDGSNLAHALFAFLLFLQQLLFTRYVAAVALGEHVLADGADGFARNDLSANGGLHRDFERWLERLAPEKPYAQYDHNRTGEDNGDAHLKRSVMGREAVVAVTGGALDLGPWEQIFYGEFDGRRRKRVLIKIIGE